MKSSVPNIVEKSLSMAYLPDEVQRNVLAPVVLKSLFRRAIMMFGSLFFVACSVNRLDDYSSNQPVLDMETFFNGHLTAHGIVKNRSGKVIRYFNADIQAHWDEQGIGTLDETFHFNDGEIQKRLWTLEPGGEGLYTARANDVVGDTLLEHKGNAIQMSYILSVPYKGKNLDLKVDDRMFLVKDDVIINESRMLKFGFTVGSVTLTILKH